MNKRKLRKVHINGNEWKYYFLGQRCDMVVFSPFGKRFRIKVEDMMKQINGHSKEEIDYRLDMILYSYTPAQIKQYIIDNFYKEEEYAETS